VYAILDRLFGKKRGDSMTRTAIRLSLYLVGGHLLLSMVLLVIVATHGISDQDASFAVAMLYHGLNLPSVWVLGIIGGAPDKQIVLVFLMGIVQWAGVALMIAAVCHAFRFGLRAVTGQAAKTSEPIIPPSPHSSR
jgi:hypothetical protein